MTHTLAELDVLVGALTEAQNDKMDTDGRNGTSTVDYVVEWKVPTSSDPTWYRLYKSGWVEQGGKELNLRWYGNGDLRTPTLPKPMQDINYHVSATMGNHTGNWGYPGCLAWGLSTTQIKLGIAGPDQGYADVYWRVEGMSAS